MKVIRVLGKAVKPFVNFPNWLGWQNIADQGKQIKQLATDLTTSRKTASPRVETFETAIRRLNMNPTDVAKRQQNFLRLTFFYCLLAVGLLFYAIYLAVFQGYVMATLVALVISALALAFAYREHFWYMQMKKRKLGCTFKDWVNFTFKGLSK